MDTVILRILDIMEWLDNHFLFTIKDLFKDLGIRNTKLNREFCEMVFQYNKIAYRVGDTNVWKSRANCFNSGKFSITLTELEHKKKIFIPGSRFAPYTNHFFRYKHANIKYNGKHLKAKSLPLTLKEIKEYYYLCPERELLSMLEFIDINNTVVNEELVEDDEIFYVPTYNISQIYSDLSLTEEDQLVFKIVDWGHVELEIIAKTPRAVGKIYKKKWEAKFDEKLKKTVLSRPSENYSIEDVIASMVNSEPPLFFHDKYFISLEDHLKEAGLLETIDFGVKDKVWVKDSPIVIADIWFSYVYGIPNMLQVSNAEDDFLCTMGSSISLNIIRFAILEFLDDNYVKLNDKPEEVKNECVNSIFKEFFSWEKYKIHEKKVLKIIKKEYQKHVKKFNPFKDRDVLDLGLTVFQLFRRMFNIVSFAEEKKLLPDKMDFTVVIMLNQFAEDVSPFLRMTGELFDTTKDETTIEVKNKKKEITVVRDKFSSFLDNVEDYIFSTF